MNIPREGWLGAMMQGGMSQNLAEIFVEMYDGFMSGRIQPKGDRMVQGKTTIDAFAQALA